MEGQVCPWCGAKRVKHYKREGFDVFECESVHFSDGTTSGKRFAPCYERQIAQLQAQINEYEGIRDQFNWQSEQNAQALHERDEEIATLQAQVEGMREVVEDLLRQPFYSQGWIERVQKAQALLTPTAGEFVVVLREDLEWAQRYTPAHWSDGRPNEHYNRIQLVLGHEPVGEWKPTAALGKGGEEKR